MEKEETIEQAYHRSIRNKILNVAVTLLLIAAVCLCLFVVVQVLSNGHVSFGGYSFFRVVTGSMEPAIPVGSLILTEAQPITEIEIGDIVSFRSKSSDMIGKIITHRVVGTQMDANGQMLLITQGDANLSMDAYYVDAENLIGKMIWSSGDGSMLASVVSFFTNGIGFFACIAVPCLIIATLILRDCVRRIRGDMAKVMDQLAEEPTDEPKEEPKEETDEEMYARIRAEVMEELQQGEDHEQSESKTEE